MRERLEKAKSANDTRNRNKEGIRIFSTLMEGLGLKVYKLSSDLSFQSLEIVSEDDYKEFNQLYDNHLGKSVKPMWRPLRIKVLEGDESLPASDFPYLAPDFPVMSRKAKEVLYDLIAPYVEFLPLQSSFGEYYGINVLEEVDALDEEASELKRFSDGRVMVVHRYVFKPDTVEGKVIFRIPQDNSIFVTDLFVDKVWESGLMGLKLEELWSTTNAIEGKQKELNVEQIYLNGKRFMDGFKDRLIELISEKTGFSKDRIELQGTIEVNIQYHHIRAYFSVGNEEYLFSHNEPWDTGDLMKTVQSWHKEKSKGE